MRVCWVPHCCDFIHIDTQSNDHYKHQWRHTAYTRCLKKKKNLTDAKNYFKKNSNIYIACIQLTPPKQSVPLLQKIKTATFRFLGGLPNHRFTLQTHLTQMKEKPAGLSVTEYKS